MTNASQITLSLREWLEASTQHFMHERMRYVKTTGLSMPQFGVLMHLFHGGGCAVSDIGKHMATSNAAASQLIDGLVEKGLIERTENPEDRRAKQITLSEKGHTLIEAGMRQRYHWVGDLVANLSSEELEAVSKALPVLIEAFKKLAKSKEWDKYK
ncbi:MAG: MarR family transcriptional regulator [Chloroflexota bacterium]